MMYFPSTPIIERLRGLFKRRVRDSELAYLGDGHGPGARVDVPGKSGFVYVHFAVGKDENGFATYGGITMARSGSAAYINAPGMPVHVAYNRSNELEVVGTVNSALDQYGIDTRVLNPLNQQSKWVYPWQLTIGLASAVANSVTASTLITVKKFRHYVGNKLEAFETPLVVDKPDLSSYIPAAGQHCYAAVWIDTYTNEAVVVTSVAQAITTPLDDTDLQETVVRAAASRPADGIPLKAFYLANDQNTLTQSALEVDMRLWLYNPPAWGFPNVLNTLERVWPNRTLVTGPYTVSGVGDIEYESGAQHIIVHKGNFDATTDPTVNDDSGDGYSVGSPWFNKSTGILRFATDVTVGAAVWEEVSGGGGMTSFDVAADTGTPETIEDGDTLTIEGGDAIETAVSATDTITIRVADGGITNDKVLINSLQLDRFQNAGPSEYNQLLGYDDAGTIMSVPYPDSTAGTLGEDVTVIDILIEDLSDGEWYKASATSPFVMSERLGVAIEGGSFTVGGTVRMRTLGAIGGFSGLADEATVYISTTPGALTTTAPTPSLGGATVLSKPCGYALDSGSAFINPGPARYMRRASLADGATLTVQHHADVLPYARKLYAAISSTDTAILETSGGAQDSSRQLRGQSGAGSVNPVDAVGGANVALGDSAGTDFRVAQSFQVTAAGQLSSIVFRSGATTGTPSTLNVPYRIETDAAGIPSGVILHSGTTANWVASADNTITVTSGPFLATATSYWFILELPIQATNNAYTVTRNAAGAYASGVMKWDSTTGASFPGTWLLGGGTNDMRVSITVAAVVANDGIAQGFSHSNTTTAQYADILLKKTGTPTGNLTLAIYSNTAGMPNAVITNGTANVVAASTLTTGYTLIRFTWTTPPTITASTQYHLVLTTADSASNTNYVEWGIDISSPPYANGALALLQSASWGAASPAADGIFDLYGVTATFGSIMTPGLWISTQSDIVARNDDGAGANSATNTTFKNTSGVPLDVTCIVELP
jgi:hypothetical protein